MNTSMAMLGLTLSLVAVGADHIVGGAGLDTVNLEVTSGSVETVYYRFSSTDGGAWVGVDNWVTIINFRRGEDKIIFLDTDGAPISLDDFLSDGNRGTNGGQLVISPRFDDDKIVGADIKFGINMLRIVYTTDSQEAVRTGNTYNALAEKYLGALSNSPGETPAGYDGDNDVLTDHSLLRNYLNIDGNDDNLLIVDDAYLETIVPDVLISESRASTAGVFATVSATDADGTAAYSEDLSYSITGGTGVGVFDLDANGGISVASTATLDYDTAPISYTLTIGVSDGLDADGTADTAVDATKTFTIGLVDVNDITPVAVQEGANARGSITETRGTAGASAHVGTGYMITITDADTNNVFDFIDFEIDGIASSGVFDFIETSTGSGIYELTLLAGQTIDRESTQLIRDGISFLEIGYKISDGVNESTNYLVEVDVDDINDNGPTVTASRIDSSIPITLDEAIDDSTTPRNVMGLTIEITDDDSTGVNPPLTSASFTVLNADDSTVNENFRVENVNGNWVLQFTDSPQAPLKAEDQATFEVIIEVSDGENPATESDSFTINVNGEAVYSISESGDTLTADLDTADPNGVDMASVRYQWFTTTDGGTTKDTIATSGTNSIANTTSRSLNTAGYTPPSGAVYGVTISYQDPFNVAAGDRTEFDVLLSPIFFSDGTDPVASYAGSINEDSTAATLPTIAARVDNAPQASTFTYEFVTDVDAGTTNTAHLGFTIDGQGAITFTGTASTDLDYDTDPVRDSITLRVRATYDADGTGNAGAVHTRDVQVVIAVTDLNDNTPEIGSLQIETDEPQVIAGFGVAEFGSPTTGNGVFITGTSADEYINGDAGLNIITSGGGADHIVGGAGLDTVNLEVTSGSVETVYYRFSSTDGGAWVGVDDWVNIINFRRGEDRLVFLDTDGAPIDLTTFLSDGNRGTNGGQLVISPRFDDDKIIGADIKFGINTLRIVYTTDSQEAVRTGDTYNALAEKYLGALSNSPGETPAGYDGDNDVLTDHSLLRNYLNIDGNDDNLLIVDDAYLETIVPDVLISESRTSTAGVFATVSANDADGTAAYSEDLSYSITGGTGVGVFDLDANGGISVASAATLDYETTSSYTLTIGVSDGLDADGIADPAVDATKTFTIGLVANLPAEYRIVRQFPEGTPLLKAEVVTPDPDGVMAGTAASYRFFLLNSDGSEPVASEANYNLQDATFSHIDNDELILPIKFDRNNVYGVEVTYTDGVGKEESVVFIEAPQPQAPPIQPSRQWEQVEVIIPDDLGLTPLPEADPNAG